ncbi:MAG: hypothetical protein EHM70_04845 [Chloroflexota bacterium]|nr:MAG: hypothetical protein EHM70_04845 [Chloroflexota bacterium]
MVLADLNRSQQLRIAVYSQDGFGLGHMRRTSSIVRQLLKHRPDASVLTLSDSPLGQLFETASNHDYLKLPSIVKDGPGKWRAIKLSMSIEEVLDLRRHIIRSAVLCFKPHLLLVDHMPHGALGELTTALEAIKTNGLNTRIVLGLRDILDAPDVIQKRWAAEHAYETLEKYYDRVLVYGMQDVYDLSREYHFKPEISNLMQYCGFVCTPVKPRYPARVRSQLLNGSNHGARLILVMAGGGADAYPMMNSVLDSLPEVLAKKDCVTIMVTGPFMPAEQRHKLEARSRKMPVRVRNTVSDILSYIEAADLVISMAGYNSTMEVLRSGKPAILIPRSGPSAEQRTRASLFSARNWVQFFEPDNIDSNHLAQVIEAQLNNETRLNSDEKPDLNGVNTAVTHLLAQIGSTSKRANGNIPAVRCKSKPMALKPVVV